MGNFSDIYGYETIKEHLQSAISMGKVSHAYVISGGLGSGKKLIASTFAQTLQCEAVLSLVGCAIPVCRQQAGISRILSGLDMRSREVLVLMI